MAARPGVGNAGFLGLLILAACFTQRCNGCLPSIVKAPEKPRVAAPATVPATMPVTCSDNQECAGSEVCCSGQCVSGACCVNTDCRAPLGVCDPLTHACIECLGNTTCGTPSGTLGVKVCDATQQKCVACDATEHPCGNGQVCCEGQCFSGGCCAAGDCAAPTPRCDLRTKTCATCRADNDCGAGAVCLAAAGDAPCAGDDCRCVPGTCHSRNSTNTPECFGACCNYQCGLDSNCCGDSDCAAANPGFQQNSACFSARSAAPQQKCLPTLSGSSNRCGCPLPVDANRYVDPLGSDAAGNGSAACPYRSITAALKIAAPGTRILLRPGVYDSSIEQFPLLPPALVSIARDPTCIAGSAVILRTDGSTTACPLQRNAGPQFSCAVAIAQPGVILEGLIIKNNTGRAVVFGTGADSSTQLLAGTIGCEGPGCSKNGGADLTFVGTAAPKVGPTDASTTLTLAPSNGSAIEIFDRATPEIAHLGDLVGFAADVIVIEDEAVPKLHDLSINCASHLGVGNSGLGLRISGTGERLTLSSICVEAAANGGIRISRPNQQGNPHILNLVIAKKNLGDPALGNGYGLLVDGAAAGSPAVQIFNSEFSANQGDGLRLGSAAVQLFDTVVDGNGVGNGVGNGASCASANGITLTSDASSLLLGRAQIRRTLGLSNLNCLGGNGVSVARGTLQIQGTDIVDNAFNGIAVGRTARSVEVQSARISGNGANGIYILQNTNVSLGRCTGADCTGGANVFACAARNSLGNGRANVCFATFRAATLTAQNNTWEQRPPATLSTPFSAENLYCNPAVVTDVEVVGPRFFGTSQVATAPENTAACP